MVKFVASNVDMRISTILVLDFRTYYEAIRMLVWKWYLGWGKNVNLIVTHPRAVLCGD